MRYISCTLRKITQTTDSIGVETESLVETTIPIIRIEKVYEQEFYRANEQGLKPSLKVRINSLNYNDEQELEYGGIIYTIIRAEENVNDLILTCSRKIKNIKEEEGIIEDNGNNTTTTSL